MQRYACNVTPLATAPDRRTREFDLVVLDPDTFGTGIVGTGIEGTVDGSVAMTRATQQLVILTST
jgi:23S rRNA G2069 N7-methylase RlmK/C1962 C5-methylase RlmI